MSNLFCKICGNSRKLGRRLCVKCNSDRVLSTNLKRFGKGYYVFTNTCIACKVNYESSSKKTKFCSNCYGMFIDFQKENNSTNNYVYIKRELRNSSESVWEHRNKIESHLGRSLKEGEIVHHIDNNPMNNNIDNLLVLSSEEHAKLHSYLNIQRVIFEKSKELGDCPWESQVKNITNEWLSSR